MNTTKQAFIALQQYVEGELGDIAREAFLATTSDSSQKSDGSTVTEVDIVLEKNLKVFITEYFPQDSVYGEEEGFVQGTSDFVWIIDPIDGTDNFARKIPFFAITVVRLGNTEEDTFSLIYNPASRQLFSSFAGETVLENGHPAKSPTTQIGGRSFVTVTGANSSAPWIKSVRQNIQGALSSEFGKSGHYHSSLLEHAYVATGKLDGMLQLQMNAWDSAAGVYLVRAGGGQVSVFDNGEWSLHTGPVKELYGEDFSLRPTLFVSRPDIHERALSAIKNPEDWK
jgi:myo-inositol-1(or 4)-monophosphatase